MSNPPPPRDLPRGFLYEMAFLVDRGVRPLAMVSVVDYQGLQVPCAMRTADLAAMGLGAGTLNVVHHEVWIRPGISEYIYAKTSRVAVAYEEMMLSGMDPHHKHVLRGLLLGYNAEKVDEWVVHEMVQEMDRNI